MKKDIRSRYVFGAALAGMAISGILGMEHRAQAATAAYFTFESDNTFMPSSGTSSTFTLFASFTGSSVGPLIAESGTGSAYGVHTSTATVYSSPAGNGSAKAFSANHWLNGDYYEFDVPTTGLDDILVSFDQTSSSTGPKAFKLLYSVDGSTFSTAASFTVGATSFAASASNTAVSFGFDLSTITALDSLTQADFRVVDNDTTTATGGTDRIDNFLVVGSSVPEPAAVSLLTAAASAALMRRRRS